MGDLNLNALSTFKNARRIKFESKVPIRGPDPNIPGPKYDLVDLEKTKYAKAASITMASGIRIDKSLDNGCPGPGKYGAPMKGGASFDKSRGFSFGSGSRLPKEKENVKAPGPGEYPIATTLGGVGVKLAESKQAQGQAAGNPGPGTYKSNFSQVEKRYGATPFTEFLGVKPKDKGIPGPGQYALPSTLGGNCVMKRSSSFGFTQAGFLRDKPTSTPAFAAAGTTFRCA
mmetsp:Transcript_14434/g.31368  ORF Transcript_14434/g.31368 Transcript_14434/m.31368 type:complete len:229 (+) Transcript_14434:86-772(+)